MLRLVQKQYIRIYEDYFIFPSHVGRRGLNLLLLSHLKFRACHYLESCNWKKFCNILKCLKTYYESVHLRFNNTHREKLMLYWVTRNTKLAALATRVFQNSSPLQRSACFYVKINGNFEILKFWSNFIIGPFQRVWYWVYNISSWMKILQVQELAIKTLSYVFPLFSVALYNKTITKKRYPHFFQMAVSCI